MDIIFLNVGHGDSIIFRWEENGVEKIGILDCNIYETNNPVVEYLKLKGTSSISFVIFSHPHIDHYSGFPDFFSYLIEHHIIIENFIHTLYGDPSYLRWAETNSVDRKILKEVITLIIDCNDNIKLINKIHLAVENWSLKLSSRYSIHVLSPSDSEIRTRISKIKYYQKENRFLCSTSSNYLSTCLYIYDNEKEECVLLTSDTTDYSFERLHNASISIPSLSATQIPHHGSSKNLYKNFWRTIKSKEQCNAVISAGFNKKYNLPDFQVVEFFDKLGFDVKSTNHVNGYKEYCDNIQGESYLNSNALDDGSELIIDSHLYHTEIKVHL